MLFRPLVHTLVNMRSKGKKRLLIRIITLFYSVSDDVD